MQQAELEPAVDVPEVGDGHDGAAGDVLAEDLQIAVCPEGDAIVDRPADSGAEAASGVADLAEIANRHGDASSELEGKIRLRNRVGGRSRKREHRQRRGPSGDRRCSAFVEAGHGSCSLHGPKPPGGGNEPLLATRPVSRVKWVFHTLDLTTVRGSSHCLRFPSRPPTIAAEPRNLRRGHADEDDS